MWRPVSHRWLCRPVDWLEHSHDFIYVLLHVGNPIEVKIEVTEEGCDGRPDELRNDVIEELRCLIDLAYPSEIYFSLDHERETNTGVKVATRKSPEQHQRSKVAEGNLKLIESRVYDL